MDLATRVRQLKHRGLPAVAVAAVLDLETDDVIALLDDPEAPVAPSGPATHVFEAADLTIPAGTNWSGVGHALGSFPLDVAAGVLLKLHLELEAAPGADNVFMAVENGPDYGTNTTSMEVHVTGANHWNFANNVFTYGEENGPLGSGSTPLTSLSTARGSEIVAQFANVLGNPQEEHPLAGLEPLTVYVGLHTTAATAAEIVVRRARAAFMVF